MNECLLRSVRQVSKYASRDNRDQWQPLRQIMCGRSHKIKTHGGLAEHTKIIQTRRKAQIGKQCWSNNNVKTQIGDSSLESLEQKKEENHLTGSSEMGGK